MARAMESGRVSKHDLRTRETRGLLLRAAEAIFTRDGYEGAELGEIAAAAGRTKGAIYAHFKSKEDIFLALIEERAERNRAKVWEMFAASESIEQNIAALRRFYLEMAEDRAWSLLLLEFKLFAIRHPEAQERLQKLMEQTNSGNREELIADFLGRAKTGEAAISRTLAIYMLQPLLSALAVEAKFAPELFNDEARLKITSRIFDTFIQAASAEAANRAEEPLSSGSPIPAGLRRP